MTVSATQSGTISFEGVALYVAVVTGAALTQNGKTGISTAGTGPDYSITITPNATGSLIFAALGDYYGFVSADPGTTHLGQAAGPFATQNYLNALVSSAPTVSGTPQSVGATLAGNSSPNFAAAEILGSALAVDGSSPAPANGSSSSFSVTTASFTPPAGAVLVALTAAYPNHSGMGMALSDSAGTYTWSKLVSEYSGMYADIWAGIPPAAGSGTVKGSSTAAVTEAAGTRVTVGEAAGSTAAVTGAGSQAAVTLRAGFRPEARGRGQPGHGSQPGQSGTSSARGCGGSGPATARIPRSATTAGTRSCPVWARSSICSARAHTRSTQWQKRI